VTHPRARPLIVVNSGAYAMQELAAEFGDLPPAFLPVGLGRLYELQAQRLAPLPGDLVLTLPDSFVLPEWDAERLCTLGFTVIQTPDALSLGSALLYALGRLGFRDRPLRILHGDTLVEGIALDRDDAAAVAEGGDGYRWAQVRLAPDGGIAEVLRPDQAGAALGPRLCGYFAFRGAAQFAEMLAVANGDFYGALNLHAAGPGLHAVTPGRWLDFGHVGTYFRSRRIVTTERAFNSLQIGEMHVRKRSGSAAPKLRAEARWLREAPPAIAPYCARVLGDGEGGGEDAGSYYYDSEYEYMPTLAELHVFGRVTPPSWSRILASCAGFVDASARAGGAPGETGVLTRLVVDKTAERLDALALAGGLDLDAPNTLNGAPAPSLRHCLREIEAALVGCGDAPAVMHGDFCFSNILYSFRTERIRLIDPRGLTDRGEFSLYGDLRYDLAKLMHSICGRYDIIMAGQYAGGRTGAHSFELLFPDDPWRTQVEAMAKPLAMGGVRLGSRVVWAAMTSLFLSMPPLHADRPDRQAAFIANALRLFLELEAAG